MYLVVSSSWNTFRSQRARRIASCLPSCFPVGKRAISGSKIDNISWKYRVTDIGLLMAGPVQGFLILLVWCPGHWKFLIQQRSRLWNHVERISEYQIHENNNMHKQAHTEVMGTIMDNNHWTNLFRIPTARLSNLYTY